MELSDFGINDTNRKTCVVLGAGASRGASFVTDRSFPMPPLDNDFFQQIARLSNDRFSESLLKFVRDEFGHEVGLTMESFYSEADYTNRFHQELEIEGSPLVKRYQQALDAFYAVLPRLLSETTSQACEHHQILASRLHADDCVISFNYDCLIDRALRDTGGNRWNPGASYGFPISEGLDAWTSHPPKLGRSPKTPINLLKMHGSMNWAISGKEGTVKLIGDLEKVTSLKGSIIPPTWFKILKERPFGDVWKSARRQIRAARAMIVIGYSVPETDLFSRSLFKVESGSKSEREKLALLVIVNPDPQARRKFMDLVSASIEAKTTILEYEHLEDLGKVIHRNSVSVTPRSRVEKFQASIEPTVVKRGQPYTTSVSFRGTLHNAFFDNQLKHRQSKLEFWQPDKKTFPSRKDLAHPVSPGILSGYHEIEGYTYESSTDPLVEGDYDVFVQIWEHKEEGKPLRDKLMERKMSLRVV